MPSQEQVKHDARAVPDGPAPSYVSPDSHPAGVLVINSKKEFVLVEAVVERVLCVVTRCLKSHFPEDQ